jgi:hypothetical protein
MNASLLNRHRGANAIAATYSELYAIDSATIDEHLHAASKSIQAILTTMASRIAHLSELIATRINYQPEILVYAQLLQILGLAELGARKVDSRATPDKQVIASVVLSDVFVRARAMLGHADPHIRQNIGKLLSLHLIRIEDVNGDGKRIFFSPKEIVLQTSKHTITDKNKDKADYEYVTVDEFASMVEVDRGTLLTKLARSEFSEDISTFRKSEVVRLLDTKGKKFFSDRKIKKPEEFMDIEDIEFADQKTVVEVLAPFDTFDLAKVISKMDQGKAKEKMINGLPRAKREEVESELKSLNNPDPIEVIQIGQRIIANVKEKMLHRD